MIDQTQGWNAYYRHGRQAQMPELFVVRFFRALRNRGDFLREHSVDTWPLPEVASILDFGCGTGRHTVFLAQEGWVVTGCDISADAVALAAKALGGSDHKRFDVITDSLPYASRYFDIVLAHGVFDHIPEAERTH